jgi:hypothetical protein
MPGNLTRISPAQASSHGRIAHTSSTTASICRPIPDSCIATIAQEMRSFLYFSLSLSVDTRSDWSGVMGYFGCTDDGELTSLAE